MRIRIIEKVTKDKSIVSLWVNENQAYKLDFTNGTVFGLSNRILTNPPLIHGFDEESKMYTHIIKNVLSFDFKNKTLADRQFLSSCWEQLISAGLLRDARNLDIYDLDPKTDKKVITKYIKYKNKGGDLFFREWLRECHYFDWLKKNHFTDGPQAKTIYKRLGAITFKYIKFKIILDMFQQFDTLKDILAASALSYWQTNLIIQLEKDLTLLNVVLDEKKSNYLYYCAEMHELAEIERNKENNKKIQTNMAIHSKWWKYEDENFTIVVPQSVAEIKEEGEHQCNCVGRLYTKDVIEGITQVVFIRKKECPEKSYITCEVTNDGTIKQFLLARNQRVQDNTIEDKFYRDFQEYINFCKKESE